MRLTISHDTRYDYSAGVPYGLCRIRLRPPQDRWQSVEQWAVDIDGGTIVASYDDQHGNHTDLVRLDTRTRALSIEASGTIDTHIGSGIYGSHDGAAPLSLYLRETPLTAGGERVAQLAGTFDADNPLPSLHALSARILSAAPFDLASPQAAANAEAVLERGVGVCQDHTHVMIACARRLDLPARYVSGHLRITDQDNQEAGHAWAEIHVPDIGWVGFDVSNGYSPDERYVRLACGLDSREAAPVDGVVFGEQKQDLNVVVRVEESGSQQ